jgi:quinolinate synthase
LAQEQPGKTIVPLTRSLCGAMYRTHPQGLRDVLQSCVGGKPINVITVDDDTRYWANKALERMLAL